jgi:two-component system, NtrC family, sensor kinase
MKYNFFLLAVSLLSFKTTFAQLKLPPVYEIESDTAFLQDIANEYYQVLEDKSGKWTIDQVILSPLTDRFRHRNLKNTIGDTVVNTYWFRYSLKNVTGHQISIALDSYGDRSDFYVFDSAGKYTYFLTGYKVAWSRKNGIRPNNSIPVKLGENEMLVIYYRMQNDKAGLPSEFKIAILNNEKSLTKLITDSQDAYTTTSYFPAFLCGFLFLAFIFNFFFFLTVKERMYLYFALWALGLSALSGPFVGEVIGRVSSEFSRVLETIISGVLFIFLLQFVRHYFQTFQYTKRWDKVLIGLSLLWLVFTVMNIFNPVFQRDNIIPFFLIFLVIISSFITSLIFKRIHHNNVKPFFIAVIPFLAFIAFLLIMVLFSRISNNADMSRMDDTIDILAFSTISWMFVYFSWTLFRRYDRQAKDLLNQSLEIERIAREKEEERSRLIELQKIELEKQVLERTAELNNSLQNLKSTQSQLIQSEKMASLGELTAGIAHEIQNPLNFVNNFSEVSKELLTELSEEVEKGNYDEVKAIAVDVVQNLDKIHHHGKRADAIVKGMLAHCRTSTGQMEPTDINALCDEYLRLAYHGLKARDPKDAAHKSFESSFYFEPDNTLPKMNVVPQDIGRVLLNLVNNAFQAVNGYGDHPLVIVSTHYNGNSVEIRVADNGPGIPDEIKDKIFQPFFTTKPTGQGTGLGLSLSYDIVKAHGGLLKVETREGEGSTFIIHLPG